MVTTGEYPMDPYVDKYKYNMDALIYNPLTGNPNLQFTEWPKERKMKIVTCTVGMVQRPLTYAQPRHSQDI